MPISDKVNKGQKIYYPSTSGIALILEVLDSSEQDFLVDIDGRKYYIPKVSIDAHGIPLDETRKHVYVAQRLEDPENDIVYLRYMWNETPIDKMYNRYCAWKGRVEKSIIPAKAKGEQRFSDDLMEEFEDY